jgi:hypothetical protein
MNTHNDNLICLINLDFQSSLIDLKYNIPRTLMSDLSEDTMVLRLGNLSSDRIKVLEEIVS